MSRQAEILLFDFAGREEFTSHVQQSKHSQEDADHGTGTLKDCHCGGEFLIQVEIAGSSGLLAPVFVR